MFPSDSSIHLFLHQCQSVHHAKFHVGVMMVFRHLLYGDLTDAATNEHIKQYENKTADICPEVISLHVSVN